MADKNILEIILTTFSSLLGAGGLAGLLRLWWKKRLILKEKKYKFKLAKKAIEKDSKDADLIFKNFVESEKDKLDKED